MFTFNITLFTKRQKKTHSTDCDNYAHVLPSARTIADCKHMQAAQVEQDTWFALFTKPNDVKGYLQTKPFFAIK